MPRRESLPEILWSLLTLNLGTKIVSVAIAMILWIVVLGSRNVEVTKEVPLEIITPADIVPANDIPDRIAFRLSGPKAFLRAVLDRREDPVRVNLAGSKPGLVTYRFFSDSIRVPIGVKVLSINPTAILIKLETQKKRDVPVRLELRGQIPEGYKIIKADLKPSVVRIKGAETRVDGIGEIPTVPVDVSELRQDLEREVTLDLARYNIALDSPLPKVRIQVEPISANYRIKGVDIRVISPYKVRIDGEKTVTVLVRAGTKDLSSLDRSKIFAVVDLGGKKKGKYREPIKVNLPPDVGLVKVIPETVSVTLY